MFHLPCNYVRAYEWNLLWENWYQRYIKLYIRLGTFKIHPLFGDWCKLYYERGWRKTMFTEDQKKFIVRAFGRNTSPTKVRQEFLKHFNIKKSRHTARYKLYQFTKLNQHFETYGSIADKSPKKVKTKRTKEKIEEVENFLAENRYLTLLQEII